MTLKTCQKDVQIVTDKSLLLLVSPNPPSCVPGALGCPGGYTASCDVKEMSQRARGRSQPVIYSILAGGMRSICGGGPESHTAALGTAYFRSHHSVSCKQQPISPRPPLCVLVAKCTDGGQGRDDLKSPTIPSKSLGGKQKQ